MIWYVIQTGYDDIYWSPEGGGHVKARRNKGEWVVRPCCFSKYAKVTGRFILNRKYGTETDKNFIHGDYSGTK